MPETSLEISVSLSREDAWDFLGRLVTDDKLRSQLEQDPAGTLAEHGIVVSPDAFPASVTLPSVDEVRELARLYAPELEFDPVGWCPFPPGGGVFATCLWVALGFAVAHQSVQPDGPAAS